MSFTESLAKIVDRVEGCGAAVIIGIDGIPIERDIRRLDPSCDIDLIATELTTLLRRSMRTAADTELGQLREMMFSTENLTLVLRPITPEYFLMLALNPGTNSGRARFELRKAQLSLESEFAI